MSGDAAYLDYGNCEQYALVRRITMCISLGIVILWVNHNAIYTRNYFFDNCQKKAYSQFSIPVIIRDDNHNTIISDMNDNW